MNARDLLKVVRERGLQVVVENGRPIIRTNGRTVSDGILAALTLHRDKIVALLTDTKGPRDVR